MLCTVGVGMSLFLRYSAMIYHFDRVIFVSRAVDFLSFQCGATWCGATWSFNVFQALEVFQTGLRET